MPNKHTKNTRRKQLQGGSNNNNNNNNNNNYSFHGNKKSILGNGLKSIIGSKLPIYTSTYKVPSKSANYVLRSSMPQTSLPLDAVLEPTQETNEQIETINFPRPQSSLNLHSSSLQPINTSAEEIIIEDGFLRRSGSSNNLNRETGKNSNRLSMESTMAEPPSLYNSQISPPRPTKSRTPPPRPPKDVPSKQKYIPALGPNTLKKVNTKRPLKQLSTKTRKNMQQQYKCLNKLNQLRSKKIDKRFRDDKTIFGEVYKLFKFIFDNDYVGIYDTKKLIKNLPKPKGKFMNFYRMYNKEEPNKNVFLYLGNKLGKQLHTEFCDGPCDKEITRNQRLKKIIFKEAYGSHDLKKGDLCDFIVNTNDYIKDEINETKRQKLMNTNVLEGLSIKLPNKLARDSYNYSKLVIDLVNYINKIITFDSKFTPKSKWKETPSNEYVPKYVTMSTPRPTHHIYEDDKTNNYSHLIRQPTRHIYEDDKTNNSVPMIKPTSHIYEDEILNNKPMYNNIGIVTQPPNVRPSSISVNDRNSYIGIYHGVKTPQNNPFTTYVTSNLNLNNGYYATVKPKSSFPYYLQGEPRKFSRKKSTPTPPQLPPPRQSPKTAKSKKNY